MRFDLFERLRSKDQLKFVIKDEVDYAYAKEVLNRYSIKANIVFQPVYGTSLRWLAEKVINDGLVGVRVLPQLHKVIWGDVRGV